MHEIFNKYREKIVPFLFFFLSTAIVLMLAFTFKNEEKIITKKTDFSTINNKEMELIKEFIFHKIKSPFENINYEIKKGDTIQKILKKLKIQNNEISTIINKYKKYGNPNQLLAGSTIDIVVEKKLSQESTL